MTTADIVRQQAAYGRTLRGIVSGLVSRAKSRARQANEPFGLTINSIAKLPTHCPNPFCGVELVVSAEAGGSDNSYSLDKINRQQPYSNNWRVCCARCNRLRSDATAAELLGLSRWERGLHRLLIRHFDAVTHELVSQDYL